MSSKNILQQALQQYEGTCIIISHDRAFLDPIVNKTLEIRPGSIKIYLGNVSYYLHKKQEEQEANAPTQPNGAVNKGTTPNPGHLKQAEAASSEPAAKLSRKEQRRLEAERRNALNRKIRPIKQKLQQVEQDIEAKELRKAEIEELMAQPDFYEDNTRVKEVTLEYEEIKKSLTDLLFKWEEYSTQIEEAEAEL